MGTLEPQLDDLEFPNVWDGNYWTNDYQRVGDQDARNMGAALLRAAFHVEDSKRRLLLLLLGSWVGRGEFAIG